MQKTLILVALFLMPLFAFGRTIEVPIGSGRMVEIDAFGNLIENHSFVWKLFNVNGLPFWSIQIVQASEETIEEVVRNYIRSLDGLFGTKAETIERVAKCESNFNPYVYGDKGKAYSVMQFWRKTFDAFKDEANMENLQYENWQDQIYLAFWSFANGKKGHWVCK